MNHQSVLFRLSVENNLHGFHLYLKPVENSVRHIEHVIAVNQFSDPGLFLAAGVDLQ